MRAQRPAVLISKSARLVRRAGPSPALIAAEVGHRATTPARRERLRRGYGVRVAGDLPRAGLHPPRVRLGARTDLPAELAAPAERIRAEAEMAVAHVFDVLGSGPVELGPRIDWHLDFRTGWRWEPRFYQDVVVTRLDDPADPKVPWELSRCHHLLTLARAACLERDERFAAELEAQLAAWIEDNPPGHGINWTCAMEVAIRAVNWLWAIGTVEQLRPLDAGVRAQVVRSLQVHGRHVAANLEGSPALRGNHYLADMLGLLALGCCLAGDPAAGRWRDFAARRLEREILAQVLPDGSGFEASLPYHGLSLEMFELAAVLAERSGRRMSPRFAERLALMLDVSRAVRHPDGRSPVIGDQDSGRILPAGVARPATHDPLLWLGAAALHRDRPLDAPPHEEVAWTLGTRAWRALAARPVQRARQADSFPHGGLYVLEGGGAKVVVRWGGVGQNGTGGHAHNDLGSYELSYGRALVVDPGTYAYTGDVAARDAMRSARAHNVLVVDGLDMHPIPSGRPFELPEHARPRVEAWRRDAGRVVLTASHDGYRRGRSAVLCRRTIAVDRASGRVEVADEVMGAGGPSRRTLESFVHLAPGTSVERAGACALDLALGGVLARLAFEGADAVVVEYGWVSCAYGVRERAPVIRATAVAPLPARMSYTLWQPEGGA